MNDLFIEAILEGGPDDLPDGERVRRVPNDEHKVKIRHGSGYEHFERRYTSDGAVPAVFAWSARTRVAE
ncbi:DUF5988 family protein [Actinoplanes sp. NPDC049118]|uniref:DUF5988 family protein n=1 Tax=Actinoplanes sp. NPDC049118 TaxID=3155769 RepID=UPI0033F94060